MSCCCQFYVDDIIKTALQEDINYLDTTTDLMIPATARSTARFMAKAEGVVCGLEVALRVFELLDPTFSYEIRLPEGSRVAYGDIIAELEGSTRCLLKGERTALNLLQHMSGVASATDRYVRLVEGTRAAITDTRKTLPGLRALQKYAVTVGGGKNHRFNLSDGAMLKDNHIDAAGGIPQAVAAIREKLGHMVKLEVETRNLDEVRQAQVYHAGTALRDGRIVTNGGRVLGVSAQGDTLDAALDTAYEAVSKIHFKDAFYRRDIGAKVKGVKR